MFNKHRDMLVWLPILNTIHFDVSHQLTITYVASNRLTCVVSRVSTASPLHMVPWLIVPSSWTSSWDTSLVSSSSHSSNFKVSNLVKSSFVSVSIVGISGTSLAFLSSLATLLDPNKGNYDEIYIISHRLSIGIVFILEKSYNAKQFLLVMKYTNWWNT